MRLVSLGIVALMGLAACSGPDPVASVRPAGVVVTGSSGAGQLNAMRAGANLPALDRDAALDAAARAHAQDMAKNGFFSHKGSDGSTAGKRAKRAGYRWCSVAENIAKGQRSEAEVMAAWRSSAGHYRNITNRKMRDYGLARVGDVWVMLVAAKRC